MAFLPKKKANMNGVVDILLFLVFLAFDFFCPNAVIDLYLHIDVKNL